MDTNSERINFFLGANTPKGFISLFNELYDPSDHWKAYIIKGGPGTGKSGLMKKAANFLERKGFPAEWIYCSSDPKSLDAVIFPNLKVCIADGTAPHVVEPKYPGAVETIVNLGDFWNTDSLEKKGREVKLLTESCSLLHQRAVRFLSAASLLQNDTWRLSLPYIDTEKIERYAARVIFREFNKPGREKGKESLRFLSGVTPDGIVTHLDTFQTLCPKAYVIEDPYGGVTARLMPLLRNGALERGHSVIACPCPLNPTEKTEHILIPSLGLGFFSSNEIHAYSSDPYRRIHAGRFMDAEGMKSHKQRIAFNRKASRELLTEAVRILYEARKTHDELEKLYIAAMDYRKVDKKCDDIIKEILERALRLSM